MSGPLGEFHRRSPGELSAGLRGVEAAAVELPCPYGSVDELRGPLRHPADGPREVDHGGLETGPDVERELVVVAGRGREGDGEGLEIGTRDIADVDIVAGLLPGAEDRELLSRQE